MLSENGRVWQAHRGADGYSAVNRVTGEAVPLAGRKRRWLGKHVVLFQDSLWNVAVKGLLSGEAWRVLIYACSVLDWDNWLVLPQDQIAQEIGLHQSNVSRAIKEMIKIGVLQRAPKPAPRGTYRLNSTFAYKGSYDGLQKRRREEREEAARRKHDEI